MLKKLISLVLVLMLAVSLSACDGPSLPKIDLHSSSLTGTVVDVDGNSCRIVVTEGDSHYRGTYENADGEAVEGKTIQVSFGASKGTVEVGCTISFDYSYVSDVSEYAGYPHITVDSVKVK